MLIEIGFWSNNLFLSNSSKCFSTGSPPHGPIPAASSPHPHEAKYLQGFFKCRKKKPMKRSSTLPCSEEGGHEGKTPMSKCLESIESDLDRLGRHQSLNPFKGLRLRKEGMLRGRVGKAVDGVDPFLPGGRLAVEFPMILNVGSIYSSHVIIYLDP